MDADAPQLCDRPAIIFGAAVDMIADPFSGAALGGIVRIDHANGSFELEIGVHPLLNRLRRLGRIAVPGDEGVDTVWASSHYTLLSNLENLFLNEGGDWSASGNSLPNRIVGNSGNNVLAGGLGIDTLEGGLGDDIYRSEEHTSELQSH